MGQPAGPGRISPRAGAAQPSSRSPTVAAVQGPDDGDPPSAARAAAVAALVLLGCALLGEVAAPARVLPGPTVVALAGLVVVGLWRLLTGLGDGPLVRGRWFRLGALALLAPTAYVVMGPRGVLLNIALALFVMAGGIVFVLAALVALWWRPRDAGLALLAVLLVPAAALAAPRVDEVRLRLLADRYRSEARTVWRDPPPRSPGTTTSP